MKSRGSVGMASRGAAAGFTLLEVVIALIIAGLATAALVNAVGTGLQSTRAASLYNQAVARARSRLAAATHGQALTAGDWRGDDGGGFRWRLHVAPAAVAGVQPLGASGARVASAVPVVLYEVTVWVGWDEGGTERQVRLDTEQVSG